MSSWTAQRVLDAAAAMEWVPEGAIEMRTDDYRLVELTGELDLVRLGPFPALDGDRRGRAEGAFVTDQLDRHVRRNVQLRQIAADLAGQHLHGVDHLGAPGAQRLFRAGRLGRG